MGKRVFMFPGQGSQYIGMGKEFYDNFPTAKEVFDKASEITGLDVASLCFEENEKINITEYTQVCMLTVEAALFAVLKEKGITYDLTAGLSLGEYGALIASGAMSMEDAFRVVRKSERFPVRICKSVPPPETNTSARKRASKTPNGFFLPTQRTPKRRASIRGLPERTVTVSGATPRRQRPSKNPARRASSPKFPHPAYPPTQRSGGRFFPFFTLENPPSPPSKAGGDKPAPRRGKPPPRRNFAASIPPFFRRSRGDGQGFGAKTKDHESAPARLVKANPGR